jgi:hypothetical protein
MMSGLTIGLLSLDYVSLQVLKNSGEPHERVYAARIIPLVRHKHLLLVTLLLCNAAAMEALPIFLDKMVPSYMAIALSVTAVLFFGEYVAKRGLVLSIDIFGHTSAHLQALGSISASSLTNAICFCSKTESKLHAWACSYELSRRGGHSCSD